MTLTTTAPMMLAALEWAERGLPIVSTWHVADGRCGCRAMDCERPGKQWTPSGGWHLHFAWRPLKSRSGHVGAGLDIKAGGGLAALPPSCGLAGVYREDPDAGFELPLAPLPAWLVALALRGAGEDRGQRAPDHGRVGGQACGGTRGGSGGKRRWRLPATTCACSAPSARPR